MKGALSALFGSKPTADRCGGREAQRDPRQAADRAGATEDCQTAAARPAPTNRAWVTAMASLVG